MWTVSWAELDAHEPKRKLVGRKWFTSSNGTFYRACKYFWTVQFDTGLPTSYNRDRSHSYKWLSTSIRDRPLSSSTSESSSNNQFGPSSFTIVRTVQRYLTVHFKVYNIKYNIIYVPWMTVADFLKLKKSKVGLVFEIWNLFNYSKKDWIRIKSLFCHRNVNIINNYAFDYFDDNTRWQISAKYILSSV